MRCSCFWFSIFVILFVRLLPRATAMEYVRAESCARCAKIFQVVEGFGLLRRTLFFFRIQKNVNTSLEWTPHGSFDRVCVHVLMFQPDNQFTTQNLTHINLMYYFEEQETTEIALGNRMNQSISWPNESEWGDGWMIWVFLYYYHHLY